MKDIRNLERSHGLKDTYSYSIAYLDFEQFFVFLDETILTLTMSIIAVLIVILIVTADLLTTLLVALCVVTTDVFLSGLIFFCDLTLNPLVMLNVIVAIGTSVDYSAHIAYAYLVQEVPKSYKTKNESDIRLYKGTMALRTMGSSVFHGGFSTFIAIVVLAPAKSYIMAVFFRLWFGIISFGMANGFILLPVILSFCGPTGKFKKAKKKR